MNRNIAHVFGAAVIVLSLTVGAAGSALSQESPIIITDPATGIVTHEERDKDDPDYVRRDPATGIVILEEWGPDVWLHRTDGPAYIKRDPATGTVIVEEYWENGQQVPAPEDAPTPSSPAPS